MGRRRVANRRTGRNGFMYGVAAMQSGAEDGKMCLSSFSVLDSTEYTMDTARRDGYVVVVGWAAGGARSRTVTHYYVARMQQHV